MGENSADRACFVSFAVEVGPPAEPVSGNIVNNYLNNLVARSLNPASALQPRLRSQFERAPSGGSLVAAQPLAVAPDETAPGATAPEIWSEPPPIISRASRRRSRESTSPAPDDVSPGVKKIENDPPAVRRNYLTDRQFIEAASPSLDGDHAGESAAPERVTITDVGAAAGSSMALRTTQALLTIRSQELPPSLRPPASAANSRGPAAMVVEGRGGIVRPLVKAVDPKWPEPSAGSPLRRNDDHFELPAPEQATEIRIREQNAGTDVLRPHSHGLRSATSLAVETGQPAIEQEPAAVVRPQVTPIFEDRGESRFARGDRSHTPASPTVHVTIGRIEVRAIPSASPSTPTPRAAQPRMNLDDYLRRRGNGGAR